MNFRTYCGKCYYCRSVREHMCEHVTNYEAGFAEYAIYGEAAVYPLPEELSLEHGALLEPVTIAAHGVDQGDIIPGRTVAICGGGTIGPLVQQIAIRAGAARVLVSDPMPEKRELAKKLGADWVVDPLNEDLQAAARELHRRPGLRHSLRVQRQADRRQAVRRPGRQVRHHRLGRGLPREIGLPVHAVLPVRERTDPPLHYVRALYLPAGVKLLSKLDLDPLLSEIVPLENRPRPRRPEDQHGRQDPGQTLIRPPVNRSTHRRSPSEVPE